MVRGTNCKNKLASPSWLEKPGVLGCIIDAYQGVEQIPGQKKGRRVRRVFKWEDGDEEFKGNAEAFVLHLGLKFGLELKESAACFIHAILRELGEVVLPSMKEQREKPKKDSPRAGKFRQPSPDKWRAR
jgi:hypothetical protein